MSIVVSSFNQSASAPVGCGVEINGAEVPAMTARGPIIRPLGDDGHAKNGADSGYRRLVRN